MVYGIIDMNLNVKKLLNNLVIFRAIRILPKSDRPKLIVVTALQIIVSILDLIAIAAMALLGALAVTGIQSQSPGNRISEVLILIRISEFSFQGQIAFLGITAAGLLIFRTIVSIILTRRIFLFLSRRSAMISANLASRFLSQSLIKVQFNTAQQNSYSLTAGISSITLGVIGASIAVISDLSLLVIMVIGLFVVDPLIAFSTIFFFGILSIILYRLTSIRAHNLGLLNAKLAVQCDEKIIEVIESYREITVRNRRSFYTNLIGELRLKHSNVMAEIQFMPSISKYAIECGIIVGAVFISGIQFAIQDASHAVSALTVFLAAGTRIAPAIMRLQQSTIQIKNNLGSANPTLEMIDSLSNIEVTEDIESSFDTNHFGFTPKLKIESISLTYSDKNIKSLNGISFEVETGELLAIVGPSGAGKTSLVDVILGLISPDSGSVTISGKNPIDAVRYWPGAISYVPQDTKIINGTFRSNITMGYLSESIEDIDIWQALETANLADFVHSLPQSLETRVGERGAKISGGQRQRLGIARALLTKPKLLILDESTSALDGQTESDLSKSIRNLKGSTTILVIAHRLSTVRDADQIVYLSQGKVICKGRFNEVRSTVPDFDKQAKLMGL
jgi:ABC-type multidrug transport system fused ATPase/permease subunit